MEKAANPDAGKQADQAREIFEQIAPMLKDVHRNVVGAVLGTILAGYIAGFDPKDRDKAVDRLLTLASNLVGDVDRANGVETEGGILDDTTREQMESNPKLAEFVRDQSSRVRQALSDLQEGKYRSLNEAMQAIGLSSMDPDDLDEELRDPPRKLS